MINSLRRCSEDILTNILRCFLGNLSTITEAALRITSYRPWSLQAAYTLSNYFELIRTILLV